MTISDRLNLERMYMMAEGSAYSWSDGTCVNVYRENSSIMALTLGNRDHGERPFSSTHERQNTHLSTGTSKKPCICEACKSKVCRRSGGSTPQCA